MTIDRKSAGALGLLGVGFKLWYALLIDTPRLSGSFSVTLLAGAAGFLPALWAFHLLERQRPGAEPDELLRLAGGTRGRQAYYLLLSAFLLVSAALSASELINVASYIALSNQSPNRLNLATVASLCLCALCGGRAVAGCSRVRLCYLPVFWAIIVLVQYRSFVPRWLLPPLADSAGAIAREAVSLSGVYMLLVPVWLLSGSCRAAAGTFVRVTALVLCASLLFGMLAPVMPFAQHTRFFRLDTLLSNGRTSLSLQLPHMIVMYTGLLTGGCFGLSMAARLLNRCFPAVREKWFVLGGSACVLGLLYTGATAQENAWLLRSAFWPLILLPLWLMALAGALRKRGKAHA